MKHLKMNFSKKHITTKDYLVSGEVFDLMLDENLGLLKTFPTPQPSALGKYYQSEDYLSHKDKSRNLMSVLYNVVKKISLQRKIKHLKKYKETGNLLDVGAGTGSFLAVAKKAGFTTSGVEPNPDARDLAMQKKLDVVESLDKLKNSKFDVITMWHVLEHIPNLNETIQLLKNFLTEDGILIIAVPNYKCYDALYYKEYWAGYDVPRHLWHFSQESIQKIFENKLTLMEIKGMPFDSFYVSLLSEKYKSGKSFSLKAIYVGFLSNLKARKTGSWSSLTYVFKNTQNKPL